jgi:hypothetical protein
MAEREYRRMTSAAGYLNSTLAGLRDNAEVRFAPSIGHSQITITRERPEDDNRLRLQPIRVRINSSGKVYFGNIELF